jgi:uncharacterized protein (DUF488 family)
MHVQTVFTVGHSTHPIEDFVAILRAHGVEHVIDVRRFPMSRRNPQFNKDALAKALVSARVGYEHLPELGGLRPARKDSANTGWRNVSFRGFADYMQTSEFDRALGRLIESAGSGRVAIMCAEAVPWRCHRSLIADALVARGIAVEEILNATRAQAHQLTPFAKVDGSRVTYPQALSLWGGSDSLFENTDSRD